MRFQLMRTPLLAAMLFLMSALPVMGAGAPMTAPEALPAGRYVSDPAHTSLTWRVGHMGLSRYTSRFIKTTAFIDYDPAAPEKSRVEARVRMDSVRTDYPFADKKDFDAKLAKGKEWLNALQFPEAVFVSRTLVRTGSAKGRMEGDLTFLGVTRPLVLDVTFNGAYAAHPMTGGAAMGFSATGTLKRSEWGFITGLPQVGDEVDLLIEIEFLKE